MKMDLSPSSNCRMFDMDLPDNLFHSDIYTVTSLKKKVALNETEFESQKTALLELVEEPDVQEDEEQGPKELPEQSSSNDFILDSRSIISEFVLVYQSTLIESSLNEILQTDNKAFYCNGKESSCCTVFNENEKYHCVDMQSWNYKPCISTLEICKKSERFFKLYDGHKSKPNFDFKTIYCLIFRTLDISKLYPKTAFRCNPSHKYQFIKYIITKYITERARQIARKNTLERQGILVREQLKRLVNFKGQ